MSGQTDLPDASSRLTFEDYLAFPSDGLRHELIGGAHGVTPSPAPRHQRIVAALFRALDPFVRAHGLGEVWLPPVDVVLSLFDVVVPDLVFVPSHQADLVRVDRIVGAPALVVEVHSRGTRLHDRTAKRRVYERGGVRELWLVDPEAACVDVLRLSSGSASHAAAIRFGPARRCCRRSGDSLTSPELPGFSAELTALFEE